jgi:transcriptional regulator GlxA family with amidase domain
MTHGVQVTYRAMLKAGGRSGKGLTEVDIIKAVGRKDDSAKKAAQSAIWWLRNHNRKGERVAPSSRGAIVVNVSVP